MSRTPSSARRFAGPRIVAVTMLVMAAAFGLNFAAGLFLAPLSARYGWGVGALSMAAAANTAVSGLLQPVVGVLVDRVGPRLVLAAGLSLLVACYLLLAGVEQLWQFLLVYPLLGGAGFAGAATLANSVLVSRWYVRDRTRMLARTTAGINLGQLLVLPSAGWLIAGYGTSTAYLVLGMVVALTAVPAAALLLRNNPAELAQVPDGADRDSAAGLAADGAVLPPAVLTRRRRLAVASFGMHALSLYFVVLHLPRYATDLGGGVSTGGQVLAVAAAASAVMMIITGRLVNRFGRDRLLLALHVVRGVSLLLAAFCTGASQLFGFAVLFGLASFPVIPLTVAVLSVGRAPASLGRLMGFVWLLHQTCAGVGVLAGGLTRSLTGTYRPYFVVAAAVMTVSSLLLWRLAGDRDPLPPATPTEPTPTSPVIA
ncbi:MFS transporter [Nonomuraea sp. NPDC049625]|uniref:MFS transporter n=1 Tax=Nonomuraea sp. NPDC049625 TaxID=3155775 RepID=UPI0034478992